MPKPINIENLNSSWTKFDSVKVVIAARQNKLNTCITDKSLVDIPTLKHFLGIQELEDGLPEFWFKINKFPEQVGLFALVASIFTHYDNIKWFAEEYNQGNMSGVLIMKAGKHHTNLRSVLVESGASDKIFRRKQQVPYNLSKLFESGEVGLLTKDLLSNRLKTIGYTDEDINQNFFKISETHSFHNVFGLTKEQYKDWIEGVSISNSLYELNKNGITFEKYGKIKALKVKQWLNEWDDVSQFGKINRRKHEPYL